MGGAFVAALGQAPPQESYQVLTETGCGVTEADVRQGGVSGGGVIRGLDVGPPLTVLVPSAALTTRRKLTAKAVFVLSKGADARSDGPSERRGIWAQLSALRPLLPSSTHPEKEHRSLVGATLSRGETCSVVCHEPRIAS